MRALDGVSARWQDVDVTTRLTSPTTYLAAMTLLAGTLVATGALGVEEQLRKGAIKENFEQGYVGGWRHDVEVVGGAWGFCDCVEKVAKGFSEDGNGNRIKET